LKGENWVPNLDISIHLYLYIKIPQKQLNVKVSSYFQKGGVYQCCGTFDIQAKHIINPKAKITWSVYAKSIRFMPIEIFGW